VLRQHHAAVVRDVLLGDGPFLDDWLIALGLSAAERGAFARRLDASREQTVMLESLADDIAGARVVVFAKAFSHVMRDAVGDHRFEAIVTANMPPS
ncbi:MAG: hypothetical protein ACI9U2_005197, partial [Bradymonadia bacterium]